MNLQHSVNIRGFGDMVRHIQARSGRTAREIVDAEAKTVLQGMIRRSTAATRASILASNSGKNEKQWATYRGKKYRIAGMGSYGRQRGPHQNRYPDIIWAGIMSLRRQSLAAKLIARGMLKQSWVQIADALGFILSVPGFVRAARSARKGKITTATGTRGGSQLSPTVTLLNFSKVAEVTGGRRLLNQVLASRVRQYRRGIQEEFKKLAAQGAALNPGAKVT